MLFSKPWYIFFHLEVKYFSSYTHIQLRTDLRFILLLVYQRTLYDFSFPFVFLSIFVSIFFLIVQGYYNKPKGHTLTVRSGLPTRNPIEACACVSVCPTKHGRYTVTNCEVPRQAWLWFCFSCYKSHVWRCVQCSGLLASRPGRTSRGCLVNGRFRTIYQEQNLCSFEKLKNNLHVSKESGWGKTQ